MFQIKPQGFTLIELVIVITILSIIAAVGLPRFMNATAKAHTAAVLGVGGALSTAVLLVKAQTVVNGVDGEATLNISNFGSGDVDVNAAGFPVSAASDASALTTAKQCMEVWTALLQNPPSVGLAAGLDRDYVVSISGNTCTFSYQPVSDKSIVYDSSNGEVFINS